MTEPVTPAQNTPETAPESKAPAKPAAAKAKPQATAKAAPAKATKPTPAKATPAKVPAAKAAPVKPAAAKTPPSKSSKAKTGKDEAKPTAPVVEPIKPGRDSWSRIASAVNSSRTMNELLKKAKLSGWEVVPQPLVALVPTGKCVECEKPVGQKHTKDCLMIQEYPNASGQVDLNDHTNVPVPMYRAYGLVRPNPDNEFGYEVIGYTKSDRRPVPIEIRAEILTSLMKETGAKTGPAGPLWDNTGSFASIRLPKPVMVGKDPVEIRVVLINSLLSGRPSRIIISPVRVATQTVHLFEFRDCPNLLELTAANDHDARVTEASEALDLVTRYVDEFTQQATALHNRKMTGDEFHRFANKMFPYPGDTASKAKRERYTLCCKAMDMLFKGEVDITAGIKGTRWAALQAVLTITEHVDPAKKLENGQVDETGRALDVLFSSRTLAQTAFRLLREA